VEKIPHNIRLPLMVDAAGFIILACTIAVQWGTNTQRLQNLETQVAEVRAAQITEGRIVRIEEQQKYMLQRVDETNQLLRQYIEEQRQARR
jgi:hypothetical protein